ncbi:MAG: NAD(P)-dependent glycerol-3-phosphate dehydrogenase [Paludisphaera borealis]|uniref:NAD(P)H-dependent glycerol-3-phosphate dehydrogenase n=1 Tax=Paludisphaera borealis TaxID=1387353 RepID=UPI00284CD3C1|nr:NAD(P)H-dependent glycerol-3-phosphate dehydrogenase [Paludisphaera borealis]MDR3619010.1 NAD(P)-dependent glycerol-3-phosphate dehydrogenase [Paludisphaera borealis]
MMNRIAVLGGGGMGTAMAMVFARSAGDVRLWVRDPEHARAIAESRCNRRHLPEIRVPESIRVVGDAQEALRDAELILAAVPSVYLRDCLSRVAPAVAADTPVLSVVKGIEFGSFARPSQIIAEALGPRPVAILSGPSHAEELARGLPASVVVAGSSQPLCEAVQRAFSHESFRIYTNSDALGVELAGALKNILGIAAGVCDGLGFGDNAKAAMLTRGLAEIARLAVHLGARQGTFYGLAGVGDLITTCYSPFGRNRSVGERIGRGEALAAILEGMENVAEGVPTIRSVHALAARSGVDMPITGELHAVLFEGKNARAAVVDLMVRMPKDEWES